MAKHTPGPWVADTESRVDHHVKALKTGRRICAMYGFAPRDDAAAAESEANARLIAAAPEQHAICDELERLSRVIESAIKQAEPYHLERVQRLLDLNRAALAKAEGRS